MSFYAINPVHPHLGAAINLRVFPLAAALEVGFTDIAEAYVFYGDGVWQQGHQMYKKEGVFCFRILQFTGARLYLRFFLIDSKGNGAYTPGSEQVITYGQYADLFDDSKARPVEVGTYIPIESQEQVETLAQDVSQALRSGAECLWLALGSDILVDADSRARLVHVMDSVQRLPSTFLQFPGQMGQMLADFSEVTDKSWVKAVVLAAGTPQEAISNAETVVNRDGGKTTLITVSPQHYLDLAPLGQASIIPIGHSLHGLELALLRGIAAGGSDLIWLILPDDGMSTTDNFWPEYAAGTGVGHYFGRLSAGSLRTPFFTRPLIPDLALICPLDCLDGATLPGGYTLSEILERLEVHGFLCSVVPEDTPWKARAAVGLTTKIPAEAVEPFTSVRQPVLILVEQDESIPELTLRPTIELRNWPSSSTALCQEIAEWYSVLAEEQSSWVVIPGTAKGEKR